MPSTDDFPPGQPRSYPGYVLEFTEEEKGLKQILKRYKFCQVCSGGSINKEGWSHKTRVGHDMRALTPEEKDQASHDWLRARRGGSSAKHEVFQEARDRQLASEAVLAAAAPAAPPQEAWTFTFGRNRRKTVEYVLENDPGYIPWALVSKVHSKFPALEMELKNLGLWEEMQQKAADVRTR